MKKKILVTGFGPFLQNKINPTELLVLDIDTRNATDFANFPVEIETLILPVSFRDVFSIVKNKCDNNLKTTGQAYAAILMLGLASGRSKISLERVGLNWIENENPDNVGYKPEQGPISPDSSAAVFTQMHFAEILGRIRAADIPVEVSLSAGGYVCNYLYFMTLSNLNIPSLFVHFPDLIEPNIADLNLNRKFGAMDFKIMKSALKILLEEISSQVQGL